MKRAVRQRPPHTRGDSATLRLALERDIRSDHWRDGERLPTERALAAQYKVARNTVRRALRSLEERKLLVRHVGRGTFKSSAHPDRPADSFELEDIETFSPADVMECRLVFEPGLVPTIVARASKADLDRMDECVQQGEAASTLEEFERWDTALHDAFAAATRNRVALSMSRSLAQVRRNAQWGILKARSMTSDRMQQIRSEHTAIVEALRNRDRRRAQTLLREHLLHVRTYMFGE